MPRFLVKDFFVIEGRPHFVLAGSIVEGEIHSGMFVCIPQKSSMPILARIDCIEFARRLGGREDTCLCIRTTDAENLEFWLGLDLVGKAFEITLDVSGSTASLA